MVFTLSTTSVLAQDCGQTDFVVNTTDDEPNATTCTIDHCSLRGAIHAAVDISYVCETPRVTRQIILQEGVEYEVRRYPLSPRHRFFTHTAFASLHKGRYKIIGNGASIKRRHSSADDRLRFFDIRPSGEVIIENLTLTNGKAAYGGAIFNNGTLTLNNVTFEKNATTGIGDGIFNFGYLYINSSTFKDGIASEGLLIVKDTHFEGEYDDNNGAGSLVYMGPTITIGGRSQKRGGYPIGGSTFLRSSFKDTRFSVKGDIHILDSEFKDYGAEDEIDSDSIISYTGQVPRVHPIGQDDPIKIWTAEDVEIKIENSLFANNLMGGPVIALPQAQTLRGLKRKVVMINNTISGNNSFGPVLNCTTSANEMSLYNVTMANNRVNAALPDSARNLLAADGCKLRIVNTVMQSPASPSCIFDGVDVDGDPSTNYASDYSCETQNVGDPQLGGLTDNLGQTRTMRPLPGSPLIDAGKYRAGYSQGAIYDDPRCEQDPEFRQRLLEQGLSGCGGDSIYKDQRGFVRMVGPEVDIGAVEIQEDESSLREKSKRSEPALEIGSKADAGKNDIQDWGFLIEKNKYSHISLDKVKN